MFGGKRREPRGPIGQTHESFVAIAHVTILKEEPYGYSRNV